MRKRQLLFLAAILVFGMVNGQKKKEYKDSSTVIIFSQSSKPTAVSKKSHKSNGETNIIKIAPLGFISGTFPVYYERAFNDFFSLQGGIGLTNRNYYRELGFQSSDAFNFSDGGSSSNNSDLADNLYTFNHRTANMGFMFALQPRFYFDSDGLEGSFFGVGYVNSRYNFQHEGITGANGNYSGEGIFGGSAKNEHETLSDLFAVFGYQVLHDRISFETTSELGIRNVTGIKYVAYATDNGNGGYNVTDGFQDYKQTKFYFNIGIKVGYHF